MVRSRRRLIIKPRKALDVFLIEYPFFLFSTFKRRRAYKNGHSRYGYGVGGLAWGSGHIKLRYRTKVLQLFSMAAQFANPIEGLSTTFKYAIEFPDATHQRFNWLYASDVSVFTDSWSDILADCYRTYDSRWVDLSLNLDGEIFIEAVDQNILNHTLAQLSALSSSFQLLAVLTF